MRRARRYETFVSEEDCDPLTGLINLFDAAMVFAVALMVAFVIQSRMTEFLTEQDVTYVKNAGKADMEIIVKKKNRFRASNRRRLADRGRGYVSESPIGWRMERSSTSRKVPVTKRGNRRNCEKIRFRI